MVEPPASKNNTITTVDFSDKNFIEICRQLFALKKEFIVIYNKKSINRCRRAADLFIKLQPPYPKGWKRLKAATQMFWACLPVLSITVVCNKALLLDWEVTLLTEENRVLHIRPKFDVSGHRLVKQRSADTA